ncbi:hypothetical protein ACH3VR_08555 [Microbacterium sp. B2969]|uniref:PH domain-containing protein n=1 Tax=Microbacterium alkaliflavum TaxID=3248839 RepID=A0ABW7Q7N0_9MICO
MTQLPGGGRPRTFRSGTAIFGMLGSVVVAALLLIDAFVRGGFVEGMLITPWVLLVLWGVYVFFYAPNVRTDASGIRLHNVLTIIDIPWGRVADVRLRWQVEVVLEDGRVVSGFGGPTRGRATKRRSIAAETDESTPPAPVREVGLIQEEWNRARERGTDDAPMRRRADVVALIAFAVIAAWCIIAVVVAYG